MYKVDSNGARGKWERLLSPQRQERITESRMESVKDSFYLLHSLASGEY
jgi:hypothetical protein